MLDTMDINKGACADTLNDKKVRRGISGRYFV